MIFVTIGTQEPFDRLIKSIIEIAKLTDEKFVVQAPVFKSDAENIQFIDFLSPKDYLSTFKKAKLIVSHAGMGTILTALTNNKPLIILPRLIHYGEHRNEHQLATAKKIKELKYAYVAFDEKELHEMVLKFLESDVIIPACDPIRSFASEPLINSISEFIHY